MANKKTPGRDFAIAETNNFVLGDAHDQEVSAWAVMVVNTGTLSATIQPQARIGGKPADDDNVAFVNTLYRKLWLNGVIGDGTLASTAITDTSLIIIPASGLSVSLNVTYTSGTGHIYVRPIVGSPAI